MLLFWHAEYSPCFFDEQDILGCLLNVCEMLIMELSSRQNCRRPYNWPGPHRVCVFCYACVISDLCLSFCDLCLCDLLILCGWLQKML